MIIEFAVGALIGSMIYRVLIYLGIVGRKNHTL